MLAYPISQPPLCTSCSRHVQTTEAFEIFLPPHLVYRRLCSVSSRATASRHPHFSSCLLSNECDPLSQHQCGSTLLHGYQGFGAFACVQGTKVCDIECYKPVPGAAASSMHPLAMRLPPMELTGRASGIDLELRGVLHHWSR